MCEQVERLFRKPYWLSRMRIFLPVINKFYLSTLKYSQNVGYQEDGTIIFGKILEDRPNNIETGNNLDIEKCNNIEIVYH